MARSRFENLEEERQEGLLREAGEEFAEKGYEQASLNAIIERAGISKGVLYYYFENKEDLFATVVDRAIRQMSESFSGFSLDELTEQSFWDELEDASAQSVEYFSRHRWFMRLGRTIYRLRDQNKDIGPARRFWGVARRWVEMLIERGQELGVVRQDLPRGLMIEITMAVGEAFDRWFLEHFDEMGDEQLRREARKQVGVFRRILEPEEREA